ncbi:hypothetical protein SIID45300_02142 [Candidatus Magnetaquicoccaceae bacterium FCR-1]|uniref:Secreted protein n=1 Tax=Candidatus Magnetaquiglobus chichijimensis TaxID=3141448 RepID=A0ABQ0CA93_9PROT
MKRLVMLAAALGLGMLFSAGTVQAGADDVAWVQKCIKDNKREGQSAATVAIYCTCMNNKMSDNETLSITAWEQTHPAEMAECEKEAGWK